MTILWAIPLLLSSDTLIPLFHWAYHHFSLQILGWGHSFQEGSPIIGQLGLVGKFYLIGSLQFWFKVRNFPNLVRLWFPIIRNFPTFRLRNFLQNWAFGVNSILWLIPGGLTSGLFPFRIFHSQGKNFNQKAFPNFLTPNCSFLI